MNNKIATFLNTIFVNINYPKKNKIKVYKENNFVFADVMFSPRLIKVPNKTTKLKFKKYINDFIKIVSNKNNNLNISNLINNFENTYFQIEEKDISSVKNGTMGGSYSLDNKKYIIKYFLPICVYHELFHLATSYYEGSVEHCGFKKYNQKYSYSIGRGINEGYTELLAERYFNDKIKTAYMNEVDIAILLEIIVGNQKMRKLYFDANLDGLISELTKYAKMDNIICFLQEVDIINLIGISRDCKSQKISDCQKAFTYIYNFLFDCIRIKVSTINNVKANNLLEIINFMCEERTISNINEKSFTCLDKNKYYEYILSMKDKDNKYILIDEDNIIKKRINQDYNTFKVHTK